MRINDINGFQFEVKIVYYFEVFYWHQNRRKIINYLNHLCKQITTKNPTIHFHKYNKYNSGLTILTARLALEVHNCQYNKYSDSSKFKILLFSENVFDRFIRYLRNICMYLYYVLCMYVLFSALVSILI